MHEWLILITYKKKDNIYHYYVDNMYPTNINFSMFVEDLGMDKEDKVTYCSL